MAVTLSADMMTKHDKILVTDSLVDLETAVEVIKGHVDQVRELVQSGELGRIQIIAKTPVREGLYANLGRTMTAEEVAEYLGIDAKTVRKYYRQYGGFRPKGTVKKILFFETLLSKTILHPHGRIVKSVS